ncbi:site-specific integrase [Clostridium sp. ZBS13]|uniref:site-specific integrase n=1 Tax=Clostridium sp. ZBS13 TaxID=2949971 RepID=UPI00338FB785
MCQKANIRNEIRCSLHTCRHYFVQAQLRNGVDVYSLSRLLGHENISITKRYLQSIQDGDIVEMSVKTSPLMNLRR